MTAAKPIVLHPQRRPAAADDPLSPARGPRAMAATQSAAQAPGQVSQRFGRVLREEPAGSLLVQCEGEEVSARRAVGCLVTPRLGDRVLLAAGAEGSAYVLSVLERDGDPAVVISASGDMKLEAAAGRLDVVGAEGVQLVSGETVEVAAKAARVRAIDAEVAAERLTVMGRYLQTSVDRIKTLATSLDAVADRVTQRAKRVYRKVAELEHVQVRQYELKASETMQLHGRNAVVTAQELVKVDAEQIHMG